MHQHRKSSSDILLVLSILTAIFAAGGAFMSEDLWLASTQWLLVSIVLGVWAVYGRLRHED